MGDSALGPDKLRRSRRVSALSGVLRFAGGCRPKVGVRLCHVPIRRVATTRAAGDARLRGARDRSRLHAFVPPAEGLEDVLELSLQVRVVLAPAEPTFAQRRFTETSAVAAAFRSGARNAARALLISLRFLVGWLFRPPASRTGSRGCRGRLRSGGGGLCDWG